jgi:glycosyltransferase involved in cell wall biosynthesis
VSAAVTALRRDGINTIALVTDAWAPQVNGVVTTLEHVVAELGAMGHQVTVINPGDFRTVPCPTYPSIRLAVFPGAEVGRRLRALRPDAVHIATEGPLGHAARAFCIAHAWPFTTSFHTQFPEYVRARAPIPLQWSYAWLRRFHGAAARTLVATRTVSERLAARGFGNLTRWMRGVDTGLFRPVGKLALDLPRPISLFVGRVAVEKNIEAFSGSVLARHQGGDWRWSRSRPTCANAVCGREVLRPIARGETLASHLSAADVFVFPSRTDTFGLVMLEAMACGIPVAAYPVPGPLDVVLPGVSGVLDEDLARAVQGALALDPEACVAQAKACSWRNATLQFLNNLTPLRQPAAATPPESAPDGHCH